MARYVSLPASLVAAPIVFGKKPCTSYSQFGSGQFEYFGVSGTFTVPAGITRVRVTAVGAGGSGGNAFSVSCCCRPQVTGSGGGGGGYISAEIDVTPGTSCTIVVGAAPGGTTCMGTQVVAFGGCNAVGVCTCPCCDNYGSGCGYKGCGSPGVGGGYSSNNVTVLAVSCGSCGGCGALICHNNIHGTDPAVAVPCQCNACACCFNFWCFGRGGAAGSYLGITAQSEFPGTLGSDLFACKAFNGESVAIDAVSVPIVKPRWPGEFVVSTSRADASIAGTAAGYPTASYIASVFGGACSVCCGCELSTRILGNAGCGGGGSGGQIASNTRRCCASYDNSQRFDCPCGQCCSAFYCGQPGNGYFVVEY